MPIEADAVVADELSVNTLNVVDSFMPVSETTEVLAGEHDRIKVYVKDDDGARLAFEGSVEELEAAQEILSQGEPEPPGWSVSVFTRPDGVYVRGPEGRETCLHRF